MLRESFVEESVSYGLIRTLFHYFRMSFFFALVSGAVSNCVKVLKASAADSASRRLFAESLSAWKEASRRFPQFPLAACWRDSVIYKILNIKV